MKLSDIIALAKQGYKVSDIKELLNMADQEPAEEKAPATTKTEDEKPATKEAEEESAGEPEHAQEPAETESEEQEPDYKALYEAEKKKRQEENRRKPAEEDKPFDESKFLQDIASMY